MPARPIDLPLTLTAFTCTVDAGGRMLMVRHERLGVVRWEVPGGHVEPGETTAEAAVRETVEETGVLVTPGRVVADCVHHWRGRSVQIVYFEATPQSTAVLVTDDPRISAIAWVDPAELRPEETSALGWPVIQHVAAGNSSLLHLGASHHETAAGWEPLITSSRMCGEHVS
ncbi:NUDIX hydrolase [Kribbella antibiotica]|uniref:NUDIX hydrolase n=1 Tax=Kribbella antibiotica TaxID=190195 RepID=A0A4R4ZGY3_9ACTN|nr:NUDIX hydrolase [Kribbella antibiotica]TDD57813.1 NUDIX hydrolase [Kribbella antibiotica]